MVGKHPAVLWKDLTYDPNGWRPTPGQGYGIKTGALPKGSGVVVVDCDSDDAVQVLWTLGPIPKTYTVQTPRGIHLYFEHPGFRVKNSAGALAKGIDIRGDGGMVVGTGSPHKSGDTYEVLEDIAPAPLPTWLADWLRAQSPEVTTTTPIATNGGSGEASHTNAAAKLLGDAWPKTGRHTAQMALAGALCREGWSEKEALDFLCTVCRIAGDEDRPKRTQTIRDTYARAAKGGTVYGWTELGAHVDRVVVNAARPMLKPDAGGEADFRAIFESTRIAEPPSAAKKSSIFWGSWDRDVKPPEWLIRDLIPVGTVGALVAHGSSLKTWVMASMAIAVTHGEPWLGRFDTRKRRALIVDYESGAYELRRRASILGAGASPDLGAWPYPDKRIDTWEFWDSLLNIEGIGLVCIDSLAEGTTPGVDENSKEAALPLQWAARYTEKTNAAVLFVHHSKKDDSGDVRKSVRGSTAIYAAMDWCYGFEKLEETDAHHRQRIVCTKPCMGAKPGAFSVELTDSGLRLHLSGRPEKSKYDYTDEERKDAILDAMNAHAQAGEREASKRLIVKEWAGLSQHAGELSFDSLVATGRVKKFGKTWQVIW
jgi:hypothetical protein